MPRMLVAVAASDGTRMIVNAARPAALIAFADHFGKATPDGEHMIRELAWLTHSSLGLDGDFDEWVKTLDELEVAPEAVAQLREEWVADGADPSAWPAPLVTSPTTEPAPELVTAGGSSSPA